MFGIGLLPVALSLWVRCYGNPAEDDSVAPVEIAPQKYFTWNYTQMNPNCTDSDERVVPCQDIRICNMAAASLAMGGSPTLCGWVGKNVPRVCCGLPLVLGKALMDKVNEEISRIRGCGNKFYPPNLSMTEKRFFEIEDSIPPVDTSDPNKFDPPLEVTPYIVVEPAGGRISRQGEFPWMVSIRRLGSPWCGGSLIDRKHILSAAHCFVINYATNEIGREPDIKDYTVHVGNIYVDDGYPFTVTKIVIHPQYNPDLHYNDLAMLTLSEEILIPEFPHICLPSPEISAMDLTGKNTTLLGWGHTSFGGKSTPVLHVVDDIPVVSNAECRESFKNIGRRKLPRGVTDDMICAADPEGGRDSCQSDSGGPLMYRNNPHLRTWNTANTWVLVGVVSFGFRCAEPGYPGVYVRVSSFMDWITKEMKD